MIEAVNGLEALARAQDCDPTVILLDVMMPGMDGLDVCRHLKSDRRFDGVPVIFVSAIDDIKQRNEAHAAWAPTIASRNRSGRVSWWRGCVA